jgi:hypothetical protein
MVRVLLTAEDAGGAEDERDKISDLKSEISNLLF